MVRHPRSMHHMVPSATGARLPSTPARPPATVVQLLALPLLSFVAVLATAGTATAAIYDPTAEPSNQYFVDAGAGLHDYALDVAITRDAVWACG